MSCQALNHKNPLSDEFPVWYHCVPFGACAAVVGMLSFSCSQSPAGCRIEQMAKIFGAALNKMVSEMQAKGFTREQIVLTAGYIRPNGKAAYTDFYEELLKVRDTKRRIDALLLLRGRSYGVVIDKFIAASRWGANYNYRNDKVEICYSPGNEVCISHYGELIATVKTEGIIFQMPSVLSKSTKKRINALMECYLGLHLYQKQGKWFVVYPMYGDVEYKDGMFIEFPSLY